VPGEGFMGGLRDWDPLASQWAAGEGGEAVHGGGVLGGGLLGAVEAGGAELGGDGYLHRGEGGAGGFRRR
jgi:hypothetical protein